MVKVNVLAIDNKDSVDSLKCVCVLVGGGVEVVDGSGALHHYLGGVYHVFEDKVRARLSTHDYDRLFVGNNRGSGLDVVKAIPREMRGGVIIVSHIRLREVVKEGYQALGVARFELRDNLRYLIRDLLAEQSAGVEEATK